VIDRFVFLRSSRSALQIVKFATDSAEDLQGERFTNWSTITRIVEDEKVHPRNMALVEPVVQSTHRSSSSG
jgi:hypothetical protein